MTLHRLTSAVLLSEGEVEAAWALVLVCDRLPEQEGTLCHAESTQTQVTAVLHDPSKRLAWYEAPNLSAFVSFFSASIPRLWFLQRLLDARRDDVQRLESVCHDLDRVLLLMVSACRPSA